ncbi:PQQ-binding-like beta-propeller repeat protein [Rubripirellula sp.]|nr:PQQ-binding-like beta-propeller repeat protein [Rubripirellula sp.]
MIRLRSCNRLILNAVSLVTLVTIGCGRSNPVSEISTADSGIPVIDLDYDPGSDWNGWRGPRGDGTAMEQSLLTEWDDSTNLRWRADVPGRGHGSPIVVGSAVYLATADDKTQQQWVIAYDRETGDELWRRLIHAGSFPSAGEVHKKATNANGTIASDGQRLYIGMLNGGSIMATALNPEGEILWQNEAGKFVSRFGYAPSPLTYKSLVIFPADNGGGGYITAFDGESGSVVWRIARSDASSYSSAVVASVGGRDQLLIAGGKTLSSYDPATGETNWQTPGLATSTCGTVVTSGDFILASGGYPQSETICVDGDGKKIWSDSTKIYEPSPIVSGDYLVGVKDDGVAFCWSVGSGEVQWKKRLGGNFSASPVIVNGLIYVSNLSGDTFVFRAGEAFELVAKNRLGNDCYASPAVSDGDLFLRVGVAGESGRKEQLVCIGSDS